MDNEIKKNVLRFIVDMGVWLIIGMLIVLVIFYFIQYKQTLDALNACRFMLQNCIVIKAFPI